MMTSEAAPVSPDTTRMSSCLLDLPTNVLGDIVRLLPGNARKPLRATSRELRCLANEATDFISLDITDDLKSWERACPIPPSMLPHVKTIRLNLPGDYVPKSAMQTLAALKLWTARPDASFQMVMGSADGKDAHRNHLPYIDFKLLLSCLAKACILQRTMELSFCCERWVSQEVVFGPNITVCAHIRLSERDVLVNRKLLRATLAQPGLTELTISEMLPQDLDANLVRMLGERGSTLTSLTLRLCDISEHDPDVPLIFDLSPLGQVRLPKLTHFAVESSCSGPMRLVAVDGLPDMLSAQRVPSLRSLALRGLSQIPLSTPRAIRPRRVPGYLSREASRLHLLPTTGCHFGAFSQLTSLELSAWALGNLSQLPSFAGLERLVLRALLLNKDANRRPQLGGCEVGHLRKLQHLVLDSVDCPHGLLSDSLERIDLMNTNLAQIHALTGSESLRPRHLSSMLVVERARSGGERGCIDLARLFVKAATHQGPYAFRLPLIGAKPAEQHAAKVQKTESEMDACTHAGADALTCSSEASEHWAVQDCASEVTHAEPSQDVAKTGESDGLVPPAFSFRLVKRSPCHHYGS